MPDTSPRTSRTAFVGWSDDDFDEAVHDAKAAEAAAINNAGRDAQVAYLATTTDDTLRRVYELGEDDVLEVKLTHEGIIIDGFTVLRAGHPHELVGTHAMTAQEWFDHIDGGIA